MRGIGTYLFSLVGRGFIAWRRLYSDEFDLSMYFYFYFGSRVAYRERDTVRGFTEAATHA